MQDRLCVPRLSDYDGEGRNFADDTDIDLAGGKNR